MSGTRPSRRYWRRGTRPNAPRWPKKTPSAFARRRRAIRDALAALPQGTPRGRLETARDTSIKPVTAEHEHRERCAKIIRSVSNELAREVEEVRDGCKEILSEELGKLPVDTSEQRMREHCDVTLKPVRDAIARRDRAQAEERRRQTEQERQDAEQRRRKTYAESRVRCLSAIGALNPIYRHLRELERREEIAFRDAEDFWDTNQKVQERVIPLLLTEVLADPNMTDERIEKRSQEMARKDLVACR